MKVSVCCKGGSGKSTLVTLLANQAVTGGLTVLVVDAHESNTGHGYILMNERNLFTQETIKCV